ncbi:MAG TPA: hypothetical protein VFW87_26630 [Pirellulales bacterium]|nr:hypothetical protein [Pirellulales bacterium]
MRNIEKGALAEARSGDECCADTVAPVTAPQVTAIQWLSSPRLRLQLYRRRRWVQRRREVPCWLVSLFLHLLFVMVLGSIIVPTAPRRRLAAILLSFAGGDTPAASSAPPVLLAAESAAKTDDAGPPVRLDAPTLAPPPIELASVMEPPSSTRLADAIGPGLASLAAPAPSAAPTPGEQPTPQEPVVSPLEAAQALAEQARHDAIVDRFIAFDIGRLRGDAGAKAKREFDLLDSRAIPSLVRGLNRAAQIHASCPVMVISYKLEQALEENHDPAMLRYALDHLGDGVPPDAPHYARLEMFLDKFGGAGPNAMRPVAVQTLLQSLQSRRLQTRLRAAASLLDDASQLRDTHKPEIAWQLIRWLTTKNAKLREAGHRALVALADGADLGPSVKADADERQAAACRWSLHFDAERFEAAAQRALQSAQHLHDAGHRDGALRFYRKLVREYAGTTAAAHAADALRPVGQLSRK